MILQEYEGWVLTDAGIVSCACLQGPIYRSIARCLHCKKWMTEAVYTHFARTWEIYKRPDQPGLFSPERAYRADFK